MSEDESKEHIVYFYRFIVTGITNADFLVKKFDVLNSDKNSIKLIKNYMLFIVDKKIDDYRVGGRFLKIDVGLFRRINMKDGKEWLERFREVNGIEFETYILIDLKQNVMAATYNSESFGILDSAIGKYFSEIFHYDKKSQITINPLVLPDAIAELLKSKEINKFEYKMKGDEVKEIMDATGESLGGIIIDSEADLSAEINYKIRYLRERPPVNRLRKVIEYISKKYEKSNQRKKVKYKNKKVIMETETGYYSLINPTLLNDPIYYDDNSTDDIYNRVFDHLVASFSKKQKEIKKAIELSKKEDKMSGKQEQLDNYD